jgi:hypothetical protein
LGARLRRSAIMGAMSINDARREPFRLFGD